MKNIFNRINKNGLNKNALNEETRLAANMFSKDKEAISFDERKYLYLPIYYHVANLNGKNYGLAVKCYKDDRTGKLVFTDETINFNSEENVIGYLYKDAQMTDVACEKYVNTRLDYVNQYLLSIDSRNEHYTNVKNCLLDMCNKFLQRENHNLTKNELLEFNDDVKRALSSEDKDLLRNVNIVKKKYKELNRLKEDIPANYMPIFCAMSEDYSLLTVCIKCYQSSYGLEFKNEYVMVAGFDLDKVGNVYLDDELSTPLTVNEIKERLSNLSKAIDFLKDKEVTEIALRTYNAENETESAFYAIARRFLEKGAPFVNDVDKQNSRIIVAKIKDLEPKEILENIYKIKNKIDYIEDVEHNIKIIRPRKNNQKPNEIDVIDARNIKLSDVELAE